MVLSANGYYKIILFTLGVQNSNAQSQKICNFKKKLTAYMNSATQNLVKTSVGINVTKTVFPSVTIILTRRYDASLQILVYF